MRLPIAPAACVAALGLVFLAACSDLDGPAELSDGAMPLPATLLEAYPLAESQALAWSEYAVAVGLGGRFTVMDETGRSRDHTFFFYSRPLDKLLTVNLVAGVPWSFEQVPTSRFGPLPDFAGVIDSDAAVAFAINRGEEINTAFPDSIPPADAYTALLLSYPVWPETAPVDSRVIAWRVDFLVDEFNPLVGGETYHTRVRYYLDPATGELLAGGPNPIVTVLPELFAYPVGFP